MKNDNKRASNSQNITDVSSTPKSLKGIRHGDPRRFNT